MLKGIDFSFGLGVTVAQIKAAGYQFVCRYLSGGNSKDIDAAELANYKAGNVPVVFVWETTGTDMTSEPNGSADARAAQAELSALAVAINDPSVSNAVVFFAADAATESALVPYMQGVVMVLGKSRAGIYGGIASIATAFDAGVAAYGWQTAAWSNGQWDDRALLRQYGSVKVGPATCDLDEAAFWNSAPILGLSDDFGQWPRPSLAPPVFPVPGGLAAVVSTATVVLSWQSLGSSFYRYQVAAGTPANPGTVITSGTVASASSPPLLVGSPPVVLAGPGPWIWRVQTANSLFTAWQPIAL